MAWSWSITPLKRSLCPIVVGGLLLCAIVASDLLFTRRAVLPTVGTASPMISAVLVAMGGARGLVAEVLWWRIAELQRQNRYAELVPLTELLVTLDPASAEAWIYNAWNLAYNVSAAHHDAADRWQWVKRGIALLERGLRASPLETSILRQLGWTFEDKVGSNRDTAAAYYQAHLSEVALPTDAAAFEKRLGGAVNWNSPYVRALYYYDRANSYAEALRVLTVVLAEDVSGATVPYFIGVVRTAWSDLPQRSQEQVRFLIKRLMERYPQAAELRALQREVEQ